MKRTYNIGQAKIHLQALIAQAQRGDQVFIAKAGKIFAKVEPVIAAPNSARNPFDRILIAQAQIEKLPLMTADAIFRRYPLKILS